MTRSTLEQALGFDIPLIVPIMLILYIAVIMVVGLWAAKKVKNSEDWFVGGSREELRVLQGLRELLAEARRAALALGESIKWGGRLRCRLI